MKTKAKKVLKAIVTIVSALIVIAGVVLCFIFFAPTYSAQKPEDVSTKAQPFERGIAGVKRFRIPSLVTMPDGTLVASCDARWNTFLDGGGLDTLVSRSCDNGKSWDTTFANYLGDNGNRFDFRSTSFIDPAVICSHDGVLYLATTFYSGGVSINSTPKKPVKEKAFDDAGNLLICKSNTGVYDYVLGPFDDNGYAPVLDKNGNAVDQYLVDRYFNIYKNSTQKGNLFFKNAPLSVVPTTFIYLNVSYDNGKTWDNPSLLNVKSDSDEFYGIAPGRGLQLDDGTLIFSTYSLKVGDSSSQKSSFIYSVDNGKTWSASPKLEYDGWSGESQLVKINSDKLRCFFRSDNSRICYCDFSIKKQQWLQPVITDIEIYSNCMLSAINCSQKIDGKRALALSCPTNKSKRADGKIFVFTLDDSDNLNICKTIDVKQGDFAYSCLSQNEDGTLAILYEAENNTIVFENNISID